jgi:hypothetical protein
MNIRMRVASLVLAGMATVAGTAASTTPAAAFTVQNGGSPGVGYVSPSTGGYVFDSASTYLNSGPITVYRSSAYSGTQQITIRWRIWQWEYPNWRLLAGRTGQATYTVRAGQYVGIQGWTSWNLDGLFATDITLVWRTPSGALIGSTFVDNVHARDYACNSAQLWCSVYRAGGQAVIALT